MEEGTAHLREVIIEGLQKHAIPFTSVQPGSGLDDLMPLKELIGEARIVALGEATHGTREFFLMKHRLLEFLVKEMNFNVFAIEATWAESNMVNEYVHTGKGDPKQALAGLHFWTWDTQEVLDMILWMRAHNQAPGSAPLVSFRGFDMQYARVAIDSVIAYLHKVAPEAEEKVKALYSQFKPYADAENAYGPLPLQTKSQCRTSLQLVYDLLLEGRTNYEAASSSEMFAHALQSARIVLQAEDIFASKDGRDLYMAENVSWLLEQAGSEAKIVLWAHNGHISKSRHRTSEESMGAHLHKRFNNAMVTFGFSFYQGSLNAKTGSDYKLKTHVVPPPPEGSYEHMFGALGSPQLFLDLRSVPTGSAVADWLVGPHPLRSIGAVYASGRDYFYDAHLLEEYDVIIHLQDTTPSTLLSRLDRAKKSHDIARQPRNLNFEAGWYGWFMTGSHPQNYEKQLEQLPEGGVNLSFASKIGETSGFGAFAQQVAANEYRGKQLRMTADVKSGELEQLISEELEHVTSEELNQLKLEELEQWAGLWMRVDGPDGQVHSFDNMCDRPIKGSVDWTRYEIILPVLEDSESIMFGILLRGKGKLWVRDVSIDIVE